MEFNPSPSLEPKGSSSVELSAKIVFFGTFLSVVFHTVLMFLAVKKPIFLRNVETADHSIAVNLQTTPVVETFQETAKDEPKDARFASDRNLSTAQETSPDRARTSHPQTMGDQGRDRATSKSDSSRTVFSLSQADVLKDRTFERETLKEGNRGLHSPGFLEKLKKGEELKVNARYFDYGNYINRMRNKLSQRWDPQKTIVPAMYSQRVVQVDIAVVLNENGEIVELYTLSGSRFSRFDDEAIRALKESAPYPNPPRSLVQEDGLVYMPWSFVLTMDSWGTVKGVE